MPHIELENLHSSVFSKVLGPRTAVLSLGLHHCLLPSPSSKICKCPPTYQTAASESIPPKIFPDLLQLAVGPVGGVGAKGGDVR